MKAEEANRETFHIGVVMIGFWDRIHMRVSARDRIVLGSSEWRGEYGNRVDRLIKTLKRKGIALYWVGLPIMRRYEVNEAAQAMNDIAREKAYLNGIKFIDIQAHFADEAGNYAPYGPDITGKQRLLREADGMLFTAPATASSRCSSSRRSSATSVRPRRSGPSRWPATRPSRSASARCGPTPTPAPAGRARLRRRARTRPRRPRPPPAPATRPWPIPPTTRRPTTAASR